MTKRTLMMAIVCLALAAPARGANLDAQLFPLTGEVRLRNPGAAAVPFVYYSIASPSGALNSSPAVWKSITDNYDLSGNGFIDPTTNWTKIEALSTQLTEGVFSGPGGSLAAKRSVSLGKIWTPNFALTFDIRQPDEQQVTVSVQTKLDGDYNNDHTVNQADYIVWRQNFGSTSLLDADGNINGKVDAADYVVYRNNFGLSIPGSAAGSGNGQLQLGAAVPEPTSAILIVSAGIVVFIARARAPRAARCAARRFAARP